MKRKLLIPLLALLATPALQAQAPITTNLGEPGYYGPIVVDDSYPKPRLMFSDPQVIDEAHRTGRPLYLHIPPGHAKDWEKHCKHYDACHQPAYFVEDSWYSDVYVPAYQKNRSEKGSNQGQGKGQGHEKGHDQNQGHDMDHDQVQGHDQSNGIGKGQSKDKAKDKNRDEAQDQGQGQGKEKNKNKDKDKDKDRDKDNK